MSIELKIPDVGESIREVQIARWLKREGDSVQQDENVVELETDKASMELPAPASGVMGKILKREGDVVAVGDVIAYLEKNGAPVSDTAKPAENQAEKQPSGSAAAKDEQKTDRRPAGDAKPSDKKDKTKVEASAVKENERGARDGISTGKTPIKESADQTAAEEIPVTPAARRALRDYGLKAADIEAKGPRIHRKDVLRFVADQQNKEGASVPTRPEPDEVESKSESESPAGELEESVPMSLIRRRIAERLVQAQQQAALLTTFNEIDMSVVAELRAAYRDHFQEKYGIKLGIMSFFVKAAVDALKAQPELNAEIRGDRIVYRNYFHIGIAIGSDKGLVVPVLRFAEQLSFAEIEQAIDDFARRAAQNKLRPDELDGGTFTITNGGVYGSLLSTPIVNPPQSGVLGMHAIQERPVARAGNVVIRPMMYVALTYDHRLVDGREAIGFLKRIKEAVEEPARMLLEV